MNNYNEIDELIKNDKKYIEKRKKDKKNFIKVILVEIVVVSFILLLGVQKGSDLTVFMNMAIIAITYIFITGAVYYSYFTQKGYDVEVEKKQIEIKRLKEYNESIEVLYNDIRSLKHDYLNIFSSMLGFIEEDDFEGFKEYFNNNIIEINENLKQTNTEIAKLSKIKVLEIKGLIAAKIIQAQKLGINVKIDILEDVTEINMSKVDLSRCLGILLDNAIEATETCKDRKINFGIIKSNESISVVITNTFEGELPPIHKIFERGFSTKGDNRGIGMAYVKEVTSNLENVFLDMSKEGNDIVVYLEVMNS